MVSYRSFSDNKFKFSRTFLSILVNLNNAVVWKVSTRPLISKSSSPCINPLVAVPIVITDTFRFHSFFFNSLERSIYLSFFSLSFNFTYQSPQFGQFFLFYWLLLGLVVLPRLGDSFISQNPRGDYASHSTEYILGCAYTICLYGQI